MRPATIFANYYMIVGLLGIVLITSVHGQTSIRTNGVIESTSGGYKYPDGTVQTTAATPQMTYAVGDTGPAGGLVFYVTGDGLHGLEAALTDQIPGKWGCVGTNIVGANTTALGKGRRNTKDILYGCETAGIAAALADEYVSASGYFDWYLPSFNELVEMYNQIGPGSTLGNVGGFGDYPYWSSTESDDSEALLLTFSNGSTFLVSKDQAQAVRPVRTF